jgi:hypothetical protein
LPAGKPAKVFAAIDKKLAKLHQTGDTKHFIYDALIFSKIKAIFGG